MRKYKLNIHNLDCANCAKKIEDYLNKIEKIQNAILNFTTSKLYFESDNDFSLEQINSLVKSIEPDAYVSLENHKNQKGKYSLKILVFGIGLAIVSMFFQNIMSNVKFNVFANFVLSFRYFASLINIKQRV